ncbi:adenine nucleotide alpha hydrolases-like protein [Whalleya microplaca]|nr:adenine nucleotide alpha hydrolases-like protein [Whalleya microplaca]
MGTLQHVMHTGARPIGLHEFIDAVRASCPPRFPMARGVQHRQVALAVSGGVDSMALAHLCVQLRRHDSYFTVSDNPVSSFRALIIDHGLREGSRQECLAVWSALRDMGLNGGVFALNYPKKPLGDREHPSQLPNFETVARKLRYRRLGNICGFRRWASLMLAHHQDDQYETVLMRLLQGHGVRGLRGMRRASDIPDCEGDFGTYQSGFVDDQKRAIPYYNMQPPRKEWKFLRRDLRSQVHRMMSEEALGEFDTGGFDDDDLDDIYQSTRVASVDRCEIDIEDGGVMIYRPLLEFSKDRLIATCLENKVPWWEDHTNTDATLTMRNAVRHLYKNYNIPLALQKPSILALSKLCDRRVQAQEAEANRLITRAFIHDFAPHIGTLTIQFPELKPTKSRRDYSSPLRRQARLGRQRELAGIVVQKILALVSPEHHVPPLAHLQNVIPRLFPALAANAEERKFADPPKAFNIAGVHCMPISSPSSPSSSSDSPSPASWYLSRAPYAIARPPPRHRAPYWATRRKNKIARPWRWSGWLPWTLWDGRFWLRVNHCLPYRVVVQPFAPAHAKALREALAPEDRKKLAAALKRDAPGKVRYTLPAVYLEEELDLRRPEPRMGYPAPVGAYADTDTADAATADTTTPSPEDEEDDNGSSSSSGGSSGEDGGEGERGQEGEQQTQTETQTETEPDTESPTTYTTEQQHQAAGMQLLALPTLGIHVPKLDDWLVYEIRYKRADRAVLGAAGKFQRGCFVAPGRAARPRRR